MKILSVLFVAAIASVFGDTTLSKTEFVFPTKECVAGLATGNYAGCAAALAFNIWKIHQWGEDTPIKLCKMSCTGNLKGRFSGFEWKWDAKFRCDTKAKGILGESTALSRDGAMEGAIKDWISKASKAKKIDIKDFKC